MRRLSGILPLHGAAQSSRGMTFSPTRAPGVRQLADIFHLDARVHKNHSHYLSPIVSVVFYIL